MQQSNLQGAYAGCLTRIAAFVIDIAIITVAIILSGWFVASTLALLGINLNACPPTSEIVDIRGWICVIARAGLVGYSMLFAPVYLLLFWSLPGQTLGKALVGVRVVRLNGKSMSFLTALRRLLGYIVTLVTLGIGFAWLVLDDRRQALHDKIAGTVVIYAWEAEEDSGVIHRLRIRYRQILGVAPTLYVAEPSLLAGKTYFCVALRPTNMGNAFELWGRLGNWNGDDPSTVLRAAFVIHEKSGHAYVTEPKYLDSAPVSAFTTSDGKSFDTIIQEAADNLLGSKPELIAVVEQPLLARLPDGEVISEMTIGPSPPTAS